MAAWAARHNATADQVAADANLDRAEAFLDLKRSYRGQVLRLRRQRDAVQEVQKRVSAEAIASKPQLAPLAAPMHQPSADSCNLVPCPEVEWIVARLPLPQLEKKYGHQMVPLVVEWVHKVWAPSEPTRWISVLQLAVDFQLATGCVGPLYDPDLVQWRDTVACRSAEHLQVDSCSGSAVLSVPS